MLSIKCLQGEKEKILAIESILKEEVVGQSEALKAVARAIKRNKAGLSDVNRPIGSFMFLGPTGVGKTQVAKTLAKFLFDSDKSLIRIDMSEYMEKQARHLVWLVLLLGMLAMTKVDS